ncbi:OPT superfamily oligopeptide transporter [Ascobolus immersus RN42]|uniref:OPT superfamily oligopeptide transporter n=1 Tax=Ascobolus immersus RN42 TaxID=1160509 RepID=A0A3N4I682_ASCIM|nr:OPT superfamily oligopeptide transporter [Ascobolus immersus RN42]
MADSRTADQVLAEDEKRSIPTRNSDTIDEKQDIKEEIDETKSEDDVFDPFVPFPESGIEESRILSIRAIVVGCILGGLVNASNVYLGLKTGWTFTANLFGAIFGYAILKFFSTTFGNHFPILGGSFGPKENAIVQTAATAAGGLGGIFVSAIPALYHLKLLGKGPVEDFPRLLTFTIVSAYYGLFFATPLRKFFIIQMAKELNLIFPTATATALAIRSMHTVGGAAGKIAMKKSRALGYTFLICIIWRVVSQYALGILWDWHIFTWFFIWGGYKNQAIAFENWGWFFEWTPAFIGSGMLVGLNPAISFFAGNILAWGIIGPTLVRYGVAWGKPASTDPKWEGYINFYSFSLEDPKNAPSPRYWLLWPGVMVMICASFAELAVQYKMIWAALQSGFKGMCSGTEAMLERFGKESSYLKRASKLKVEETVQDPFPDNQQVKAWEWFFPLILTIILTCVVLGLQYHLSIGLSILSIVLGFLFASLAIQCTGSTDVTPLTTAAKATQLILGGASSGQGLDMASAQKLNLIGGAIASGAASQSTDLVVDFRVGFLLRTPPRLQWAAQALGSVVAMFLAPGMFVLFTKAYPCILDVEAEVCSFPAPSVSAWRAVAIAVTDPTFPVPNSSGIFSIIFGVFAAAVVVFRHYVLVGSRAKYRIFVPNFMAIGLAFVLPTTIYGNAMLVGALVAHFWAKKWPVNFDVYCYGIAAGAIAGEGMGGVINAILQVADVAGDKYGTNIGCPGDQC